MHLRMRPFPATYVYKGEDQKKGDCILKSGLRIKSQHIAIIASCGMTCVTVSEKIRTGILSTGSELAEPGSCGPGGMLPPGKIYNSNAMQLYTLVKTMGPNPPITALPPIPRNIPLRCYRPPSLKTR
jgi:molybdopterin molybdotransferase